MNHCDTNNDDEGALFSRASALALLGFGGAAALTACGSVGASSAPALAAAATACAATLEGEIGPYFADDSLATFNRADLRANLDGSAAQSGIPLTLTLLVVDTKAACAAMSGVQIDLWHCNGAGVYSDIASQNTSTQTWLRGYQITGSSGSVTFTTIVPGWYQGRTTHIHVRVRSMYNSASSTSDGSNTTQVFFPQTVIDTLATSVAPYSGEGKNPTTNASDRVYAQQTQSKNELVLTGSASSGYAASFTVGLPIG